MHSFISLATTFPAVTVINESVVVYCCTLMKIFQSPRVYIMMMVPLKPYLLYFTL